MKIKRRHFLQSATAVAAALGLNASGLLKLQKAFGLESADGGLPVVWLQGQSCGGCSISMLNSYFYMDIGDLLLNVVDMEFHPNVMAGCGNLSIAAAERAYRNGGYVLVVEGSIPMAADGDYCHLWPGLTALKGVERFAKRAAHIMAVGACASFGGMVSGQPNPTDAQGLESEYNGKTVIKIPGCPVHPDWVVGTIAYMLENEEPPPLDFHGRPEMFFQRSVHEICPYNTNPRNFVQNLSEVGCLEDLGCKGPRTMADCPTRQWNGGGTGEVGINWCIGAGAPCFGCTEPDWPDGKSPFYKFPEAL